MWNHALSERCNNLIIHLFRSFAKYTMKEFIKYISFPFGRKGRLTIVFSTAWNTKITGAWFNVGPKQHISSSLYSNYPSPIAKGLELSPISSGSLEDFAFLHKRRFFWTRIRNSEINHGIFLLYFRDFVGILCSTASINSAFHASQTSFISSTKKAVVQGIFEKSSRDHSN